ncbi:DEAD/DEAH box helicase family protein [Coccidioides posadasii C735 delta SOWgp]|uniref:DNA 3'-5' helicase n=1 Tax=Coccidioides posadasii (strain C735) TaxID=222929 RepID=C5PFY0_COCP7|nr:DEAD/DEAH box helicase family protein [Coccidioides posadasii C735 delta SOWgp]EER23433.1 DEAD/DEAH box helicase family protein [Coccidioides posadasii C735 delta SOWgp]|eukprot:XP_003065578.1 DEAD/DEAH box helicase family protein [Coccidioides posadasii C735 delta SOWgp]
MDDGAGKNARQLLNTFRYPSANRSKISYGSQTRFSSQMMPSSRPSWPSRMEGLVDSDRGVAQLPSEHNDLPLDAFAAKTPSGPSRAIASSPPELEPLDSPLKSVHGGNRPASIARANHQENIRFHWPLPMTLSSPRTPCPSGTVAPNNEPCEIQLKHAPPIIQGIQLVPTHELPDRLRSIFPFSVFNAIQSKCFRPIYLKDDNFAISAPTGSGKTVVMELAICRLISKIKDNRFKVVYQAPTKSLCSERFRDWCAKFAAFDLQCAELTGDTEQSQLRNVQNASIIITTPEKWDSMTRKWKDHMRLMQLIKLFLIDEVHILKETRGATLEVVVSRMKSANSSVRFIALSATVPNSEDIATWLGRDPTNQHLPAHHERFGEEFRPVKLQKFVYGYQSNGNDFVFEKVCDSKLPEVISKHSRRKPIMIFCCTRHSAISTSKNLAKLWTATNAPGRLWNSPKKPIIVQNQDLKATVSTGVAFHHAGLDTSDRHAVEMAYLQGHISVICCTSTLAVGINLPCHLVIIKNTVSWQDHHRREYTDLETMQMLGRAGRPQFDNSATAVILTKKERVDHYQKLVTGSEPLESCLHFNLIDHLNAEVGLGTVTDIESATMWLAGTFFFTRLQKNPTYYNLKEGCDRADEEEMMRQICEKDIKLLQECSLITERVPLKSTEFGDVMARYYVKFETMKAFIALPPKAKMSEILSAIAQADEFREIRLKAGERSLYKEINKSDGIKFPIKVDIGLTSQKISLLIQSELGSVEVPAAEQYQKHRFTFQQDKSLVFAHVNRLIRCIIDCQISRGDSISARHALELGRSLGARVWDTSPLQMKQIDQIGVAAVRRLALAGINSIEALEAADAHRIDAILSKNPPFGMKLLGRLEVFPKPRVSLKMIGKETNPGKWPIVTFKADIGFINERIPSSFNKKPVYVCFLAETSDGRIIDFRRISASRLHSGQDIMLKAELTHSYQHITCYVMCDEIAGTLRQAELKPNFPESYFSGAKVSRAVTTHWPEKSVARSPIGNATLTGKRPDEFSNDGLDDNDLIAAVDSLNVRNKDVWAKQSNDSTNVLKNLSQLNAQDKSEAPIQLSNGKWACSHRCKDKTACKHLCCREGIDRPPKISQKPGGEEPIGSVEKAHGEPANIQVSSSSNFSQISVPNNNRYNHSDTDVIDLTGPSNVVKSALRYKYVKKRNEKEFDFQKPSIAVEQHASKSNTVKADNVKNLSGTSFLGSGWENGLNGDADSSSDFGSVDIDDLFPLYNEVNSEQNTDDPKSTVCRSPVNNFDYDDYFDVDVDNTFEAHQSPENEVTEYDQYILSPDKPIPEVFSAVEESPANSIFLKFESTVSQQASPLKSTLNPTIFSPTGVDSLLNPSVSSDSLFFHTPSRSGTKRSRDDGDKGEHELIESDSKRVRVDASGNSNTGEALDGWEEVDLELLEEFKDIVDFV